MFISCLQSVSSAGTLKPWLVHQCQQLWWCLFHVCSQCPQLEHLNLGSCTSVNNFGDVYFMFAVSVLAGTLKPWLVHQCQQLWWCLFHVCSQCPQLEHLNLGSCTSVNNFGDVCFMFAVSVQLEHLNLGSCTSVWCLFHVCSQCPQLEHLNLGSCTSVNNFGDVYFMFAVSVLSWNT